MSGPSSTPHPLIQDGEGTHSMANRFLLSALAFQRSRQLREGAIARVARNGHKPTYIAVLEVLANTISWTRTGEPAQP
jgi:DNA-directed RNA polymerase subunit K/omega